MSAPNTAILIRVVGRCKIALASDSEMDEFVIVETAEDARLLIDAIDTLSAQNEALVEALRNLLVMLPSTDHMDAGTAGIKDRIPAGFCYVRWLDILEARAALELARGKV